jgi:hypothetical protein
VHLGTLATNLRGYRRTSDNLRSTWECGPQAWEYVESLLVHLEIIATTHFQRILKSCIQFVFSSMYLCIYISMYLSIYTGSIWTGYRRCLSAIGGTPGNGGRASLEMHLEAVIARTWRRYSSELRDALGGGDRVNLEVYLEVVDLAAVDREGGGRSGGRRDGS